MTLALRAVQQAVTVKTLAVAHDSSTSTGHIRSGRYTNYDNKVNSPL